MTIIERAIKILEERASGCPQIAASFATIGSLRCAVKTLLSPSAGFSLQRPRECRDMLKVFDAQHMADPPLDLLIVALAQRVVNRAADVKKRAKARKAVQ